MTFLCNRCGELEHQPIPEDETHCDAGPECPCHGEAETSTCPDTVAAPVDALSIMERGEFSSRAPDPAA